MMKPVVELVFVPSGGAGGESFVQFQVEDMVLQPEYLLRPSGRGRN